MNNMKKKIIYISLIIVVTIFALFFLTGCKKSDESDVKSLLKDVIEAVNKKDAKKIISNFDLTALEKAFETEIKEDDLEKGLNSFFEDNKDFSIKLEKVQKLLDDDEALKDLYDYYDSYDEYVKEIENDYSLKDLVIYTAKLEVPENYEDLYEDSTTENGKDVVYIIKNDGKYKVVYSNFIVSIYYDYLGEDAYPYDEEYDEDYDEDYDEEYDEDYDNEETKNTEDIENDADIAE